MNQLNHFAVHLKLRQNCKSTILQLLLLFFFLKTLCKKDRGESGREAQIDIG